MKRPHFTFMTCVFEHQVKNTSLIYDRERLFIARKHEKIVLEMLYIANEFDKTKKTMEQECHQKVFVKEMEKIGQNV